MFSALYVVEDLEAYLAEPEGYAGKHGLLPADELLKLRRERKQWKLEELVPFLSEADAGRSYAKGKRIFELASCTPATA